MAKFEHSKDEAKYQKAMEYLEQNKKSFGILLDYQKLRISSLLNYKHIHSN